jgi:hypothetical protein
MADDYVIRVRIAALATWLATAWMILMVFVETE